MIRFSRYDGNPNIGIFAVASESFVFTAYDAVDGFVDSIAQTLDVDVIKTTVANSIVVGSLIAMNSNGAIVSDLITDTEIATIKEEINTITVNDKLNATGNNILVNDFGAIVNPEMDDTVMKRIEDILGVECVKSTIAYINTVGSVCRATNKGAIVNPHATDDDIKLIKEILKVDAVRTTVNHGCKIVSSGILANSKGALVGDATTAIEVNKIEDALILY